MTGDATGVTGKGVAYFGDWTGETAATGDTATVWDAGGGLTGAVGDAGAGLRGAVGDAAVGDAGAGLNGDTWAVGDAGAGLDGDTWEVGDAGAGLDGDARTVGDAGTGLDGEAGAGDGDLTVDFGVVGADGETADGLAGGDVFIDGDVLGVIWAEGEVLIEGDEFGVTYLGVIEIGTVDGVYLLTGEGVAFGLNGEANGTTNGGANPWFELDFNGDITF